MPSRPTFWQDSFIVESLTVGGVQTLVDLEVGLTDQDLRNATLTRTVMHLWFGESGLSAAKSLGNVVFGLGLMSQDAFVLGATAAPNIGIAGSRPPRGWVVRESIMAPTSGSDTTRPVPTHEYRGDIRSQRKREAGHAFMVLALSPVVGPDPVIFCRGLIRQLWKMP